MLSLWPPHLPEAFDNHVQIHQVGNRIRFAIIQSFKCLQIQRDGENHTYRFRFGSQFAVWISSACWPISFQVPQTISLPVLRSSQFSLWLKSSPHLMDTNHPSVPPSAPGCNTYCQIRPVSLNQVSKTMQQLPPVRSIHPPPRRAQLESSPGCLNSLVHICL